MLMILIYLALKRTKRSAIILDIPTHLLLCIIYSLKIIYRYKDQTLFFLLPFNPFNFSATY